MSDAANEGRRGNGPNSKADPTIATKEAVALANAAERDYVDGQLEVLRERLAGIDRATELRLGGVEGIPAQIAEKVNHLRELTDEKFLAIKETLSIAETLRVEQKEDSKTSLDAALSAQKEAAREQNASNTLAINKSQEATTETIKTNQELVRTQIDNLRSSLDEVKLTITGIVAAKVGVTEQRVEQRAGNTALYGLIGAIAVLIFVSLALYAATRSGTAVLLLLEGAL